MERQRAYIVRQTSVGAFWASVVTKMSRGQIIGPAGVEMPPIKRLPRFAVSPTYVLISLHFKNVYVNHAIRGV